MASLRNFVHALAVLVAVGLSAAAPTNAAQDNLIDASSAGDLSQVKALLAAKADVNAKTAEGRTALMLASQNGHPKPVRGGTALVVASEHGQVM
jgi:ankyrin repeat protein